MTDEMAEAALVENTARSPQGEDHEVGIAAIIERWLASGKPTSRRNGVLVPDCVAEIMALLSPSRERDE
jgi:hypothetical protein